MTDSKGTGVPDTISTVVWSSGQCNPRAGCRQRAERRGQAISPILANVSVNQSASGSPPTPTGSGSYPLLAALPCAADGVMPATNGTLSCR